METFLKSKEIQLEDKTVTIKQLSGLDRFDFMDYCTDLEKPVDPVKPAEDASLEEQQAYLYAVERNYKAWTRLNFIGQARLVAYGYVLDSSDLEERHSKIMASMTPEQVTHLHNEIAEFSGMSISTPDTQEEPQVDAGETKASQEPVDPKV